jgi:hypothetical protein
MFFIVREEDHAAVLYVSVRFYETQSHSQMYSLETMKRSASTPPPDKKLILSRAPKLYYAPSFEPPLSSGQGDPAPIRLRLPHLVYILSAR